MPAKILAARYPDDTIIVVPIPLAVAHAIGCRPNVVVSLRIRDGEISVVPDPIRIDPPNTHRPTQNATDLWVNCQSWWKKNRGAASGIVSS